MFNPVKKCLLRNPVLIFSSIRCISFQTTQIPDGFFNKKYPIEWSNGNLVDLGGSLGWTAGIQHGFQDLKISQVISRFSRSSRVLVSSEILPCFWMTDTEKPILSKITKADRKNEQNKKCGSPKLFLKADISLLVIMQSGKSSILFLLRNIQNNLTDETAIYVDPYYKCILFESIRKHELIKCKVFSITFIVLYKHQDNK